MSWILIFCFKKMEDRKKKQRKGEERKRGYGEVTRKKTNKINL